MILIIDTDASPLYYEQNVQLEGVVYVFVFKWSGREGCWYLGIFDQDEDPIIPSMKLVLNWPLFIGHTDDRLPPGRMILVDTSGKSQEIQDPSDLNSRVVLTYITSDDPDVALIDKIAK